MALNLTLRKTFLYIFATVGLVLCIISGISFINLGLKTYVLKKADNYCYNYASPVTIDKDGKEVPRSQAAIDADKKNCEEQRSSQRQTQAANAIAMLIIGTPLFFWTWSVIQKEKLV